VRSSQLLLVLLSMLETAACTATTAPAPASSSTLTPTPSARVACAATVITTLPGVTVKVKNARCNFTLGEAEVGIHIDYEVIIKSDLPILYTAGEVTGEHQAPLHLTSTLSGQGQRYCLCDTGPGVDSVVELRVAAGTYPGSFDWNGRNFTGPSDTGRTPGPAFPVGDYVLALHGEGSHQKPATPAELVKDYDLDVAINVTLDSGPAD
jgi:hypothetical protein